VMRVKPLESWGKVESISHHPQCHFMATAELPPWGPVRSHWHFWPPVHLAVYFQTFRLHMSFFFFNFQSSKSASFFFIAVIQQFCTPVLFQFLGLMVTCGCKIIPSQMEEICVHIFYLEWKKARAELAQLFLAHTAQSALEPSSSSSVSSSQLSNPAQSALGPSSWGPLKIKTTLNPQSSLSSLFS
jgi:hypothetical protein